MTLSASISNALSGLSAAARGADVVSSNLANAMTETYGRRELVLAARVTAGGGVMVAGVLRAVEQALQADRRAAQAAAAGADIAAGFHARIERRFGAAEDAGSVVGRAAALEAALIEAASRPDSGTRLARVLDHAQGLAGAIRATAAEIAAARTEADRAIARDVDLLNATLDRIAGLNAEIRKGSAAGRDVNGLIDQRQALIDRLAEAVPLREVARDGGAVALYTAGGAMLLDGGVPARFGFVAATLVTPDMTVGSGGLSGLTLDGRPMATEGAGSQIAGGRLAANFALRDRLAPEAQARLDALARDLVERFGDAAADPTLAPGAAGLFTDAGGPFDPADEVGLAGRLAVNPLADPARGGALWRLRDGLGAAAPGPEGEAAGLIRLGAALEAARLPASGGFTGGARSFAGLAAEVLSLYAGARVAAEGEAGFAAARHQALRGMELAGGVDSDRELQRLLEIEKAWAANARVLQTVDDMLRTLLSI